MNAVAIAVVAMLLPRGAVVDVSLAGEGRVSAVASEAAVTTVDTLAVRPGLRTALQSDRLALDASYTPQFSLVVPSQDLFLALHSAALGGEVQVLPRLTLRARAGAAVGDLDPGTAQRQLFSTIGVVDASQPVSYGNGTVEVGALWVAQRNLTVDTVFRAAVTGNPFRSTDDEVTASTLRTAHTQDIGPRVLWLVSARDALILDVMLKVATLEDLGVFRDERSVGVLTAAGYRRRLASSAAVEMRGGALTAVADAGDGKGRVLAVLPLLDAHLSAVARFGAQNAIEADIVGGLVPTSDPLGSLLDDRLTVQASLLGRVARDYSLAVGVFAAVPVVRFGGSQPSQAGAGASATLAWAFMDQAALTAGVQMQNRLLPSVLFQPPTLVADVTASLGVSMVLNAWHTGSRPRGSDTRPGRGLGEVQIGQGRSPAQPIEEPEPESEPEVIEETPPELVPPPVNPPLEEQIERDSQRKRRKNEPVAPSTPTTPAAGPASRTLSEPAPAPATSNSRDVKPAAPK